MSFKQVCDVCGREMRGFQLFWRLREMSFLSLGEKKDICDTCMYAIADMCKAKREKENESK